MALASVLRNRPPGGSTTNIVIIPPGKMSKLVISFSVWECHMKVARIRVEAALARRQRPGVPRNGLPLQKPPKVRSCSSGRMTGKGLPWSGQYSSVASSKPAQGYPPVQVWANPALGGRPVDVPAELLAGPLEDGVDGLAGHRRIVNTSWAGRSQAGCLSSSRPSRAMIREWLPWGWNGCRSRPAPMTRISTSRRGACAACSCRAASGARGCLRDMVSGALRPLMNQ